MEPRFHAEAVIIPITDVDPFPVILVPLVGNVRELITERDVAVLFHPGIRQLPTEGFLSRQQSRQGIPALLPGIAEINQTDVHVVQLGKIHHRAAVDHDDQVMEMLVQQTDIVKLVGLQVKVSVVQLLFIALAGPA